MFGLIIRLYASPVFSRNVYSTTKYKPILASIPCKQTKKIIKIISATVTVDSINHAPSVYIAWTENTKFSQMRLKMGSTNLFNLILSVSIMKDIMVSNFDLKIKVQGYRKEQNSN